MQRINEQKINTDARRKKYIINTMNSINTSFGISATNSKHTHQKKKGLGGGQTHKNKHTHTHTHTRGVVAQSPPQHFVN